MRYYVKPELKTEVFDVEDIITTSGGWFDPGYDDPTLPPETEPSTEPTTPTTGPVLDDGNVFAHNPYGSMDMDMDAAALEHTTLPLDGQVSGGSIVQEGLNTLYENFLSHF